MGSKCPLDPVLKDNPVMAVGLEFQNGIHIFMDIVGTHGSGNRAYNLTKVTRRRGVLEMSTIK